jgi:lipopolysaccharide transport system permease protein
MKPQISIQGISSAAELPKENTPSARPIVIEPRSSWAPLDLSELWEYRDLLYFLIWRDLKARYRQTALGPFWIVLQPIISMALYTILFGYIAKLPSDGIPYSVFSYVGLMPWGFFASSLTNGSSSLLGSKDLISKIYFPRFLNPLAKTIGSLIDLSIEFIILVLLLIYYRLQPTWGLALIPLFLFIAATTGLGFGMLFSGLVVKYRDFGNLVGYISRTWMYTLPIVYSVTLIPEQWRFIYSLNPMFSVIVGFRWALTGTEPPSPLIIALNTVAGLLLFICGMFVFKRVERDIVDLL